jgi:hypothetical protein
MSAINTAAELQAFYDEHIDVLSATSKAELIVLLTKDVKKELKGGSRAKRAPKLDNEGNIIKQELNPGMITWRKFYKHINTRLIELTGQEKFPSTHIVTFASVLKNAGHYYDEAGDLDLADDVLLQEFNKWNALSDEQKFPNSKKSSKTSSAKASAEHTDVEASEAEVEAPVKAKGRPKKVEKVEEPAPVVEEAPKKTTGKSKKAEKVEEPVVEEKPKKTVAKKTK